MMVEKDGRGRLGGGGGGGADAGELLFETPIERVWMIPQNKLR